MGTLRELSSYPALVKKMKTYYPDLNISSSAEMDNALLCIVSGFPNEFSNNLKKIRNKLGFTQRDMANKLNISVVGYAAWENGTSPPRVSRLKDIFERLYFIDPSEFISLNPVLQENSKEKQIPIFESNFFYGLKTIDFLHKLKTNIFSDHIRISSNWVFDYGVIVDDTDMIGYERAIPVGAVVLCSVAPIDNKSDIDIYRAVNKNVSIVSIMHSKACLRETFFNEEFLTLRPWNQTQPEKMFPVQIELIDKLDEKEKVKVRWNGFDTHIENIEIFGVAKKVIFDLDSVCR